MLYSEHMYVLFLGRLLGVKLLGLLGELLGDPAKQFSKVVVPIYIPISNTQEFQLFCTPVKS